MASKHNTQDFNFQYYVDTVKQKRIPWDVFVNLMEDLSFSDVNRLKYLNAILLCELTNSYSDMDRLKYLNVILMNKFKDFIQLEDDVEISENENLEVNPDLNDETINEISSDSESQISGVSNNISIPSENEKEEDLDSQLNEESKCEGYKDYECDSCGKSFTKLRELKQHLHTVHDGYKDHKCESCGKSFTSSEYLKKHFGKFIMVMKIIKNQRPLLEK